LISVLGYELERAKALLQAQGVQVCAEEEVRSRKGLEGDQKRVIRQTELPAAPDGHKRVSLNYSVFCTTLEQ